MLRSFMFTFYVRHIFVFRRDKASLRWHLAVYGRQEIVRSLNEGFISCDSETFIALATMTDSSSVPYSIFICFALCFDQLLPHLLWYYGYFFTARGKKSSFSLLLT